MLISPKIPTRIPYEEKEYLQMAEKLDSICGEGYSKKNLELLLNQLDHLSKENKTFNKNVCRELNKLMRLNSTAAPCAEAFNNSIYIELYKTFRNYPIQSIIQFIESLPFMSEKEVNANK